MGTYTFNQEMKKLLKQSDNPALRYVNDKFKESTYTNYSGFFDNFLYNYGIISFGSHPLTKGNKYIPYVHCTKNNIFIEEKGIIDLSNKGHSQAECQRIISKYLISQLKHVNVQVLKEWQPELNHGI